MSLPIPGTIPSVKWVESKSFVFLNLSVKIQSRGDEKMTDKNIVKLTNTGGTGGVIETSDGMTVDLKPPVIKDPAEQLSPKHLIGMAWSACLNATIASIFDHNEINNKSRVRVEVESKRNKEHGLHYILVAYVAIEGYDEKETMKVARHADRLCPVSKLITENPFVSLAYEQY